jgi:hypothetical protein
MVAEAQRGTLRAEARSIPAGTTVALTLQGLATIEANVTGGQPPEGQLRVVLQGAEQRMETAAASAPTVTVERLLPGHYQLEISAEGGVATTEVDVSAREHVRLEMPLRKWGRVSGQILDVRTEQPLAGVALISAGTPKTMGEILAGASNMMALMSGSAENTTDADGKFEIGQLPVGESLVQFMCTTPSLALCGVVHVDLQSEQHQELGVVHGLGNATDSTSLGTLGVELGTPRPEPEQRRILTVNDLDASGPARRAGIRKGDRVLSIDGIEVERIGAQVARRLLQGDRLQTGEMRTLVLERGGNQLTVRVQAKAGDG